MKSPANHPKTLLEAIRYFSDLDVATQHVAKTRWPDGPACPVCALADELGVSPEKLYSPALIESIEKYENERIARELTEAYANIDQNEDVDFLNNAILHYDPRFADE